MADVDPNAVSIRWRDAVLILAISDVSGLKEAATVQLNGSETLPFAPSVGVPGVYTNGIHAKLGGAASVIAGDAPLKPFTFRADLVFTGSTGADVRAGGARNEGVAQLRLAAPELHRLVPASRAQRFGQWLLGHVGGCRISPAACRTPGCSAATAGSTASASISSASRSTSRSTSTITSRGR